MLIEILTTDMVIQYLINDLWFTENNLHWSSFSRITYLTLLTKHSANQKPIGIKLYTYWYKAYRILQQQVLLRIASQFYCSIRLNVGNLKETGTVYALHKPLTVLVNFVFTFFPETETCKLSFEQYRETLRSQSRFHR